MADQPRRGRNRPDSSQMWDEADRRNNHARHERDNKSGRNNNDHRGGDDNTSRRHNNNDRNNRSRSRSPRRDRDRDNRGGNRDRNRDYDRRGPHRGGDNRQHGGRADESRRYRDDRDHRDDRHRRSRYDDSPPAPSRRSRSPSRLVKETSLSDHNSPLPSRPKTERNSGKSTPMSFKVGSNGAKADPTAPGQDSRESEENDREDDRRSRGNSAYAEERRSRSPPRGDDHDAMDEDDDGGDDDDDLVEDDGGMDMAAMMGFGGFGSTKGKKVSGNNAYYVRKEKKTEYRQYMNRVGGFNRPLSPTRE